MYEEYTVYGPYTRKDGRKHVILYNGKTRKTLSYPRYLMAQKLGRELTEDETVDHKDNNYRNDSIDNLRLLSRVENIQAGIAKLGNAICDNCQEKFVMNQHWQRFCSQKCKDKYWNNRK